MTVINGHNVKKIGEGEFCKAFLSLDDNITVYLLTNDTTREIYTHVDSIHTPEMETLYDEVYYCGRYYTAYQTKFYHPLTKQSKEAWRIYRILSTLWSVHIRENMDHALCYDDRYVVCYDFIDLLRERGDIPESIIDALDAIYTWATCFGSNFLFEFEQRNLKVDDHDNLILLDVVYFR